MNQNHNIHAWLASGVPCSFTIGNDGMPYAVLPNEYEADDYAELAGLKEMPLACCGGFSNAVMLQSTIGV